MTMHAWPASMRPEFSVSLVPWRSQYPKFDAMLGEGASPLKALRYLGLTLWQEGRLDDAARILQMAATFAPDQANILTDSAACFARLADVQRR